MSDSLRSHGLQHARLLCPWLSPRVCSDSCPLSQWCYLTVSSSAASFSFCLRSLPASRSFPLSQFFASGGQKVVEHLLYLDHCARNRTKWWFLPCRCTENRNEGVRTMQWMVLWRQVLGEQTSTEKEQWFWRRSGLIIIKNFDVGERNND